MPRRMKTMTTRLKEGLRRAIYAALGWARTTGAQAWYSLTAPSETEELDRADVRPMFLQLRARYGAMGRGPTDQSYGPWRPEYAWGMLSAARTAAALGMAAIAAIEVGVAGGNGLLAMESYAYDVERLLGLSTAIVGFDTGTGMPPATDHRDAPFAVREGHFDMDVEKLRARLRRAELKLGPVGDTAPQFLQEEHPPIGFVSFDVDYYSSTMEALALLEAPSNRLLPRVFLFFQGLMWHPWTEFNGARAAIDDFNGSHERRKVSALYGLKYSLPGSEYRKPWPEMMYVAELFDHELYAADQRVEPFDTRLIG
jgi:hypothetical protein